MKMAKKTVTVLLSVVMLFVLCVTSFAAESDNITVTLRIEGAEKTLFYGNVQLEGNGTKTALDVITKADELDNNLNVTVNNGYYGAYISAVNGEAEGQIMYDGWMFLYNGISPSVGIGSQAVQNGDNIVLYYCDSMGTEGFQYPEMDISGIKNGVIVFTSKDTVYDPVTFAPTTTVNPVIGATVHWSYGNNKIAYTTDSEGKITIDSEYLTAGSHLVSIEKYSETTSVSGGKLPLVLRMAPNTEVEIAESNNTSSGNSSEKTENSSNVSSKVESVSSENIESSLISPKTGDNSQILFVVFAFALVALASSVVLVKKVAK